jgi:oligoribonuclease NrnB/cAMP/cGMP phosphodiesterase (DHH superfamily)
MYNYDYIIYHKDCIDGFSSFFILTKVLLASGNKNIPIILPDMPSTSTIPHNIEDKNIIIMDVAYKTEILEQIIIKAKSVIHIDHHITIRDDVIRLANIYKNKFISFYDVNECGASLTWKYFSDILEGYSEHMPKFIKYVKDNDIGIWKYSNTMPFITALHVHYPLEPTPKILKKWDKLFDQSEITKLINIGKIYMNYEKYLLDWNLKRYTIELFPGPILYDNYKDFFSKQGQYRVAVVNGSGCPSGSQLGKKIVDEINCDFCILWTLHMDKKKYILSFRSKSADVGEIAKLFGGGGHKFASACSIDMNKYNITDLFYPDSLPRY